MGEYKHLKNMIVTHLLQHLIHHDDAEELP